MKHESPTIEVGLYFRGEEVACLGPAGLTAGGDAPTIPEEVLELCLDLLRLSRRLLQPKPPRAPGVTLGSLRERMNRPFIEALARFATEGTDAVAKACDRPLFPGLTGQEYFDKANRDGVVTFFVNEGSPLDHSSGSAMPSNQTHVTIRPGLEGAVQAMVGGLTEREQQVLKERFGVPKRSRETIVSDIANTRLNICKSRDREELRQLNRKLDDLYQERDDLDKP